MDMTEASIWHLNEVKVQVRSRKNAIGSVSAKDSVMVWAMGTLVNSL